MKPKAFRRIKRLALFPMVIFLLFVVPMSCDEQSNNNSNPGPVFTDSGRGARLQASLDRVEKVLQLNPDGTVSMDQADADYASLTGPDLAFGKAVIARLNTLVQEGLVRVNPDFSVDWLGPPEQCAQCPAGSSCQKHWWGEQCAVSSGTTKDVCIGLESGEGALIICGFIPVVDVICEIIEAVGTIPLEAEICPCSSSGSGSILHVTWLGIAWFKCS